MKQQFLKVVAGATLMLAMAVGFQMNRTQNSSSINLSSLAGIALADGEESGVASVECREITWIDKNGEECSGTAILCDGTGRLSCGC